MKPVPEPFLNPPPLDPAIPAGPVRPRYALLINPFYPKGLHAANVELIPWTHIDGPSQTATRITVECNHDRIRILLNGVQLADIRDSAFTEGYVGMAQYGYGHTRFRNLLVEELP